MSIRTTSNKAGTAVDTVHIGNNKILLVSCLAYTSTLKKLK
jgi:hypothetical protein